MQTFAQIAHGIKWNYIYMMTDILTYTHSILGSPISLYPKNMFPSAVFAEMTIPTKGLFSTSITSPCIQSLACVKSGDINTLSPVLIIIKI